MKVWILGKTLNTAPYNKRRFIEAATQTGIDAEFVMAKEFEIVVTKEGDRSIRRGGKPVDLPDCLLPRRGSATTYFELAFIRHLESLGVLVINSSRSIRISKDKLETIQVLQDNNIPIPRTMLAKYPFDSKAVKTELGYPVVVKAISGSLGREVFLCKSKSHLEDMLHMAHLDTDKKNVNLIFQQFIKESKGKDIRVIVVGGRPIGAMLRKAKGRDFKSNFHRGGSVAKYDLNPTLEWLAVQSAKALKLDIAGVDLLFDGEDGYMICEVNSSPMFEGFESATGLDFPKTVFEYIKLLLDKEQD